MLLNCYHLVILTNFETISPFLSSIIIGLLFIAIGIYHFVNPTFFVKIVPDYIPNHKAMVFWSGVAEVVGGIGIMIPQTKTYAGWGLILLLIAVFPANIDMFIKAYQKHGMTTYTWLTLLRLPLQFILIYWVFWAAELKIG
ncbi:MAG: hypothetical protein ABJR05_17075 [Balneola sp.]